MDRISRRIVLIDGPALARLMYDHGIGVRTLPNLVRRVRLSASHQKCRASRDSEGGCDPVDLGPVHRRSMRVADPPPHPALESRECGGPLKLADLGRQGAQGTRDIRPSGPEEAKMRAFAIDAFGQVGSIRELPAPCSWRQRAELM